MYFRTYTYLTDTGVPLGTTGLIFTRISCRSYRVSSYAELNRLIIIRDSRRSYRAYSYSGLNSVIIIRDSRRSYRAYSYSGLNRLIIIRDSRRNYRAYLETGVPVGTTKLIQIQEYPSVLQSLIRYRSTCRYYRT